MVYPNAQEGPKPLTLTEFGVHHKLESYGGNCKDTTKVDALVKDVLFFLFSFVSLRINYLYLATIHYKKP